MSWREKKPAADVRLEKRTRATGFFGYSAGGPSSAEYPEFEWCDDWASVDESLDNSRSLLHNFSERDCLCRRLFSATLVFGRPMPTTR
jgi:hypothetical protein